MARPARLNSSPGFAQVRSARSRPLHHHPPARRPKTQAWVRSSVVATPLLPTGLPSSKWVLCSDSRKVPVLGVHSADGAPPMRQLAGGVSKPGTPQKTSP